MYSVPWKTVVGWDRVVPIINVETYRDDGLLHVPATVLAISIG